MGVQDSPNRRLDLVPVGASDIEAALGVAGHNVARAVDDTRVTHRGRQSGQCLHHLPCCENSGGNREQGITSVGQLSGSSVVGLAVDVDVPAAQSGD